jgi:hypothetical protein
MIPDHEWCSEAGGCWQDREPCPAGVPLAQGEKPHNGGLLDHPVRLLLSTGHSVPEIQRMVNDIANKMTDERWRDIVAIARGIADRDGKRPA